MQSIIAVTLVLYFAGGGNPVVIGTYDSMDQCKQAATEMVVVNDDQAKAVCMPSDLLPAEFGSNQN